MKINIERLKSSLINLGKIGYEEGKGITRSAFTPEYEEAKAFVKKLMEEAGLDVYQDPVGNLFGRLDGKDKNKSILLGSHIDSVPNGGMFDGNLGVLAGIECIRTLKENNYAPKHSIEVVAFIGEEGTEVGGTFGSRVFSGEFKAEKGDLDYLKTVGITEEDLLKAKRNPETLK
ncbi:MAG TPA: M20/M25/M40 family metallo-hydrolase, partial [Tissierellia bacterium]|nr:M20/M25/M40 family metallo-hydrolase [Tissierellia bacterium]